MTRISDREVAILGLLLEGPHHGYEIEAIVEERGMRNWTEIGFSSIYYVLKTLDKRGLIESRLEGVDGKPSRRVYCLTPAGVRASRERIKEILSEHTRVSSQFDLGIAYMDQVPMDEARDALRKRLDILRTRQQFLLAEIDQRRARGEPRRVLALFELPLARDRAEEDWIEGFLSETSEGD
jgi:DNA-binding PadR family transcriptional regulator